jgi:hypothetical protein
LKIFEKLGDRFLHTETDQKTLLAIVEDFTFVKQLKHFGHQEKVDMLKLIEVKKVSPG